jgi:hypothetical protein
MCGRIDSFEEDICRVSFGCILAWCPAKRESSVDATQDNRHTVIAYEEEAGGVLWWRSSVCVNRWHTALHRLEGACGKVIVGGGAEFYYIVN